MLNLIISFIGDSYDDVSSKKQSAFTYERNQIINEIDKFHLSNFYNKKIGHLSVEKEKIYKESYLIYARQK